MPKQRHIGFIIFGVCSALSARLALFEPKAAPITTEGEERWGKVQDQSDSLHLIRGARYYIYGLGVVGLLMVVEDSFKRPKQKKSRSDSNCQRESAESRVSGGR